MATIEDIAARTRLPIATVRRILRGDNKERWPSAREKGELVRRVAAELGYRRNTAARATRTGRLGTIALVLSDQRHRSDLPVELLNQLSLALAERELHLIVSVLPDSALESEDYVPDILGELACDGVLLNYHAHVPPRLEELLERFAIPAIWVNRVRASDAVCADDLGAAREATAALLRQGHRRVAYADAFHRLALARDLVHYSKEERLAGYREAVVAAGARGDEWLPAPEAEDHGALTGLRPLVALAHERLAASDAPSAILCYGSEELHALVPVIVERGLQPGRDVVLATFGGPRPVVGADYAPTMQLPHDRIARTAVAMLERKIAQPDARQAAVREAWHAAHGWTGAPD